MVSLKEPFAFQQINQCLSIISWKQILQQHKRHSQQLTPSQFCGFFFRSFKGKVKKSSERSFTGTPAVGCASYFDSTFNSVQLSLRRTLRQLCLFTQFLLHATKDTQNKTAGLLAENRSQAKPLRRTDFHFDNTLLRHLAGCGWICATFNSWEPDGENSEIEKLMFLQQYCLPSATTASSV